MKKARITIEFIGEYSLDYAKTRKDEVAQLFMMRNPIDELIILIESSDNGKDWVQSDG